MARNSSASGVSASRFRERLRKSLTLIEEAPQIFFRPPYVGKAGWIGVEMAAVDDGWLESLIREAFQLMAAMDRAAASTG
jgi:hypothetical protein